MEPGEKRASAIESWPALQNTQAWPYPLDVAPMLSQTKHPDRVLETKISMIYDDGYLHNRGCKTRRHNWFTLRG